MSLARFAPMIGLVWPGVSMQRRRYRRVPDPQFITMTEPWPYPFSSAVRTGGLLFVSGQIGTHVEDGAPKLVAGGLAAETRQTLDNIRAIVEKAGTSMDRVVKCVVMLADMQDWPEVNTIYATYFPGPKPARSAFGATGLALGARVEIECIAKVRLKRHGPVDPLPITHRRQHVVHQQRRPAQANGP